MVNHARPAVASSEDAQRVLDAARKKRRASMRSNEAGPFSGKHVPVLTPVLPPEWDMTPQEYAAAVQAPPTGLGNMVLSSGAAVGGAGLGSSAVMGVWAEYGATTTVGVAGMGAAWLTAGVATLVWQARRHRTWRRHDRALEHCDPADVIDIGARLPHHVWTLLHDIVALNDLGPDERDWDEQGFKIVRRELGDPVLKEREERLTYGYRLALTFERPDMPAERWTMRELIETFPDVMGALAEYGLSMRTLTARNSAKEILAALVEAGQRRADVAQMLATVESLSTGLEASRSSLRKNVAEWEDAARYATHASRKHSKWTSVNSPVAFTHAQHEELRGHLRTVEATHTSALGQAQSGAQPETTYEAQWAEAVAVHDRVAEAWTELVTDPLAALEHSLLLDVTQPRTAAFIEAYGDAQDLRSLHGTTYPTSSTTRRAEEVVREYLRAVRKADEAWTEAVRHARHVHLNWLPEDEAKRVRRASALLRTADDDETPLHLRVEAAQKAADLLKQVHTFTLPTRTAEAIEAKVRLSLCART